MLFRLRSSLLVSGALLMAACGFGLTVYNARWCNFGAIKAWSRQWGGVHERMFDSSAAAASFGLFCFAASITGIVFLMIDFNKMITSLVFIVAIGMFLIEMIPELIILGACHTFSSDNELYVPYEERNYYNTSTEYKEWADGFWPLQMALAGSHLTGVTGVKNALMSVGGWFSALPSSVYWHGGVYDVVRFYNNEFDSRNAWGCVVDFTEGKTVWEYQLGQDRSVCDTMKVTTTKCIGRWNENGLLSELKRLCNAHWDREERSISATTAEAMSKADYQNHKDSTDIATQQALASFYVINSIFFGMQVVAALLTAGGVALSFILKME